MPKAKAKPKKKPAAQPRTLSASAKKNGQKTSAKGARVAPSPRASAAKKKVAPVPPGYGTATAHLTVSPCAEALDFYAKAFGAKVKSTLPGPGGLLMHAEIKIGDSIVMCADEMPMPGQPTQKSPKNAGLTTGSVMLYVKDVDSLFDRAVAAGAKPVMPPADQFWGDRYGQLEDPFGHIWSIATHIRDVTPKDMRKAMAQMEAAQA